MNIYNKHCFLQYTACIPLILIIYQLNKNKFQANCGVLEHKKNPSKCDNFYKNILIL